MSGATVFKVAGCQRPNDGSDILCSYTGFMGVAPLLDPATGLPLNPVDFSALALSKGLLKGSTRKSLKDTSATAQWPLSSFIQPLW